jgi:hypothetical protein
MSNGLLLLNTMLPADKTDVLHAMALKAGFIVKIIAPLPSNRVIVARPAP